MVRTSNLEEVFTKIRQIDGVDLSANDSLEGSDNELGRSFGHQSCCRKVMATFILKLQATYKEKCALFVLMLILYGLALYTLSLSMISGQQPPLYLNDVPSVMEGLQMPL